MKHGIISVVLLIMGLLRKESITKEFKKLREMKMGTVALVLNHEQLVFSSHDLIDLIMKRGDCYFLTSRVMASPICSTLPERRSEPSFGGSMST